MPHLGVQHGEEAEQEVAANHVREVEGEIPPETFFFVRTRRKNLRVAKIYPGHP